MPIREFVDARGVRWRVWSTVPMTGGVVGSFRDGWLTFESGEGRRRLAPIPLGWEDAAAAELSRFCERAEPFRRTPPSGGRGVDPGS